MKNKFNQINKEIILNYVVKNTSLRKKNVYKQARNQEFF